MNSLTLSFVLVWKLKIPLEKYEDFLIFGVEELSDYLAVRGLKISEKKIELVARAFVAFELKLEIVASSEDQLGNC